MARSDLLIKLVDAALGGDQVSVRRTLEAIVADERLKQHHVLADRLFAYLGRDLLGRPEFAQSGSSKGAGYVHELTPRKSIGDLVLPGEILRVFRSIVEEQQRVELLRSHSLEPRNRVLLAGPPGNGKTSLAEALAYELAVPLIVLKYEAIIGAYLGETAQRLREVFDFARGRRCVLFLDEFDTLGKERGDIHDTGEVKRVVSSLLLQIDDLPSHVLIVAATNHAELLDRAVWRRFQARLYLPSPTLEQTEQWLRAFEVRHRMTLDWSLSELSRSLAGLSYSEIEDFCTDILRRIVLGGSEEKTKRIVGEHLQEWTIRLPGPRGHSRERSSIK